MKNLNLGKFMQDSFGNLHGKISGFGIGSVSVISESATSSAGKEYQKLIAEPMGEAYEIGAAFPKEKDGLKYFSVSLDSPLFPFPINAALFPNKDIENSFNLVWSRVEVPRLSADAAVDAQQPRRYVGASTSATL